MTEIASTKPWSIDADGDVQDIAGYKVIDCHITPAWDVAYIVKACNNFEELLAQAKSALQTIDEMISEEEGPFEVRPPWVEDLREAIAKAEQE